MQFMFQLNIYFSYYFFFLCILISSVLALAQKLTSSYICRIPSVEKFGAVLFDKFLWKMYYLIKTNLNVWISWQGLLSQLSSPPPMTDKEGPYSFLLSSFFSWDFNRPIACHLWSFSSLRFTDINQPLRVQLTNPSSNAYETL